jgi:hypothetical protein
MRIIPVLLCLALLGCTDTRLEPLQGVWVVDQATLATDPRLTALSPSQRSQVLQRTLARSNPRFEFKGDSLTITEGEQVHRGAVRIRSTAGAELQLETNARPISLTLDTAANRLIVRAGAHQLTLQRVDTQPPDPLKGPLSGADDAGPRAEGDG